MYCQKCGTQNPDAARICSSCGSVLPASTAQAPIAGIKTSRLAIASLVLAILSPFTCFISAIPAIILGTVALVKISKSNGQLKGIGPAVTGIALPALLLPFALFFMGMLMTYLAHTRQAALRVHCITNLHQISLMMQMYTDENDGKFPTADSWCELLIEYAGAERSIFHCKASATPPHTCNYAINKNIENFDKGNAPPDMVLVFESQPGWNQAGGPELQTTENHRGLGCYVLFADGRVEFVPTRNLDKLKW